NKPNTKNKIALRKKSAILFFSFLIIETSKPSSEVLRWRIKSNVCSQVECAAQKEKYYSLSLEQTAKTKMPSKITVFDKREGI
ncbi:MAG: hypothetical protein L0J44_12870, partial [Tetragenococcus koreensis]|nr:hypothetical protein [Tetragenococcus koreensis]